MWGTHPCKSVSCPTSRIMTAPLSVLFLEFIAHRYRYKHMHENTHIEYVNASRHLNGIEILINAAHSWQYIWVDRINFGSGLLSSLRRMGFIQSSSEQTPGWLTNYCGRSWRRRRWRRHQSHRETRDEVPELEHQAVQEGVHAEVDSLIYEVRLGFSLALFYSIKC